jgi:MFS family permease
LVGFGAFFTDNSTLQWRLPLALAALAPLILTGLVWFVPESPRFLAWKDRNEEAWAVVQKIHHDPNDPEDSSARAEFLQISKQVQFDRQQKAGYWQMFKKPSWRKRSLTVIFLLFASQSTGILGIGNYSFLIYENLGFKGYMVSLMYVGKYLSMPVDGARTDLDVVYIIVGTIPNIANIFFVDKIGRRTMLRK